MKRTIPPYIIDPDTRLKIAHLNTILEQLESAHRILVEKFRNNSISPDENEKLVKLNSAIPKIEEYRRQIAPTLVELTEYLANTVYKDWNP